MNTHRRRDAFLRFIGKSALLVGCMMGIVAMAAWQDGLTPGQYPGGNTVENYKVSHVLNDAQHKNYAIDSKTTFSIGSQAPIYAPNVGQGGGGGGGAAAAFSPFLALVSGNFVLSLGNQGSYTFPEATYSEGFKKIAGNIMAETRSDSYAGANGPVSVWVPGFIKADLSANVNYTGNTPTSRDVLYIEGGTENDLPANAPENDMVNIFLGSNNEVAYATNRFGIEKATGFASLRMGEVAVDKAFIGGVMASLTAQPAALGNFIGNYIYEPDSAYTSNPLLIQGGISSGAAMTATSTFSNVGYGDYCYLQNPINGVICPDGFYLSKYDGDNEAICRSFNPSANPQAVTVPDDFRRNINLMVDVSDHITLNRSSCKSTPPTYVCSDNLDNDGDGDIDGGDPGCHTDGDKNNNASWDKKDMSEKNMPPPPAQGPTPIVTTLLLGPYLTRTCNQNGIQGLAVAHNAAEGSFLTFLDTAPTAVTSGYPYTPPVPYGNPGLVNVPYINNMKSQPQVPVKGDLVLATGHYGPPGAGIGNAPYVRKGPVLPGWYFISSNQGAVHTKIKINANQQIVDTKICP